MNYVSCFLLFLLPMVTICSVLPSSKISSGVGESKSSFDPYKDNGGTVVGIAGQDYCILAADTRLSDEYCIKSRSISRLTVLGDRLGFAASGCWADATQLAQKLKIDVERYGWKVGDPMPPSALAYLLSNTLYKRRNFPYFSFCISAGLTAKGTNITLC